MKKTRIHWSLLLFGNFALCVMLGLYGSGWAAPASKQKQPFSNPVEQRAEIIRQLEKINTQLQQQTLLLQSGKMQVVVVEKLQE